MGLIRTPPVLPRISTTATSMPSIEVPLMMPATLMAAPTRWRFSLTLQLCLEIREELYRFNRAQFVQVEAADTVDDRVDYRLEELDLRGGRERRGCCGGGG